MRTFITAADCYEAGTMGEWRAFLMGNQIWLEQKEIGSVVNRDEDCLMCKAADIARRRINKHSPGLLQGKIDSITDYDTFVGLCFICSGRHRLSHQPCPNQSWGNISFVEAACRKLEHIGYFTEIDSWKVLTLTYDQNHDPDYIRADGKCICQFCGELYRDHPWSKDLVGLDGRPFLKKICTGLLVKL